MPEANFKTNKEKLEEAERALREAAKRLPSDSTVILADAVNQLTILVEEAFRAPNYLSGDRLHRLRRIQQSVSELIPE